MSKGKFIRKKCGVRVGLIAAPKELSGTSWKHFTNRKINPPHQPVPVRREGVSC